MALLGCGWCLFVGFLGIACFVFLVVWGRSVCFPLLFSWSVVGLFGVLFIYVLKHHLFHLLQLFVSTFEPLCLTHDRSSALNRQDLAQKKYIIIFIVINVINVINVITVINVINVINVVNVINVINVIILFLFPFFLGGGHEPCRALQGFFFFTVFVRLQLCRATASTLCVVFLLLLLFFSFVSSSLFLFLSFLGWRGSTLPVPLCLVQRR